MSVSVVQKLKYESTGELKCCCRHYLLYVDGSTRQCKPMIILFCITMGMYSCVKGKPGLVKTCMNGRSKYFLELLIEQRFAGALLYDTPFVSPSL